ncbi:precorrin-3B C17-methyltransferase [Sulfobacillus acidophilus TPY]|uniref:Cobalt-precorrin 3 C17-methyltransferase n=1 Tax=Sulfobacillus acidophilus (strain ATCC 700253 / DSM 10332 / NAL) TaxID=679936 RepID=G8TU88_SULAD|nr:precorrin-3B C17-methyltransferase [Sulfobacillus acidophilus TPY]AEW05760.1 cobalt-precorrin 3 C17-methyltransferase [Sulfobacillus acidophilus DSM 10332]
MGRLYVVGFGPGHRDHMTGRALDAISTSDVIVGYKTYVDLVRDLIQDQMIIRTGMTEEVQRAQKAVELARAGKTVAVISSGDAGLYGMAGIIYEVLIEQGWQEGDDPAVEVIPGISAIHAAASLLGAPVMHDACTISLSDHLTPWDVIARRLEAAAAADFVIALYNPKSGRRTRQIEEAQRIILRHRSPDTPVGLVKSAYRERQQVVRTTLGHMLDHEIGMLTTVIIGNSTTVYHGPLIVTPRGYQRKYTLSAATQPLKPGERLKPVNEPWALHQGREDKPTRPPGTVRDWADEALACLTQTATPAPVTQSSPSSVRVELAVAPGVANKTFEPRQLALVAELAGESGSIEYTPSHQLIFRTEASDPDRIISRLTEAGLWVFPVGDVVKVKACDFCDGDKQEGIPYAEDLTRRLGGLGVAKELRIGFNGCAMSCYGAVHEDIALVFRKGRIDLFLGGKTGGRTAHPAHLVAEGLEPREAVERVERIVRRYQAEAFPGERFYRFFERVGEVDGFRPAGAPRAVDPVCGTP